MSKRSKHMTANAAAAILLVGLSGCGGSNPSTPTPVPTPTPRPTPVTTTLRTGSFTGLEPGFVLVLPFGSTLAGDVEASVDWTFAENDLDLLLASGNDPCSTSNNQFDPSLCTVLATATSTTAKPERLRLNALPSGSYTLYVLNLGPGGESLSYNVLLTYTPSAGTPGAGLSALGRASTQAYTRRAAPAWRSTAK